MKLSISTLTSPSPLSGEGGSRSETGGELGVHYWTSSPPSVSRQGSGAVHLPRFAGKEKIGLRP
jgi:hypothetical protein